VREGREFLVLRLVPLLEEVGKECWETRDLGDKKGTKKKKGFRLDRTPN
jgi:hypothetical protein